MTPEQRIVAACIESGVDDLISPGILRNLVRSVEEACRAALRERDAAWRKAFEGAHYSYIDGMHLAGCCNECAPLRALLEEAGK